MSFESLEDAYHGTWAQSSYGQSSEAYGPSASGYLSRSRQPYQQPSINTAYCPYQISSIGGAQYSYTELGTSRASYIRSPASSSSAYHVAGPMNMSAGAYSPSTYITTPQYTQHSQGWPNPQQSQNESGGQSVMQSHIAVSPVTYSSPPTPLVAPSVPAGVDLRYGSSNTWPNGVSSVTGSSYKSQAVSGRPTTSGAECVVPCPYNCGTVLTGIHAVGNMTRHLKSQNCVASGKDKTRYACPVQGCDKRYIRSDGLKVHLRKRHDISQMSDRNSGSGYDENRYEYP